MRNLKSLRAGHKCTLHPLIHTFIELNPAHNAVGGQVNVVKKPPLTSPPLVNGGGGMV
jgi:hypothetical protein